MHGKAWKVLEIGSSIDDNIILYFMCGKLEIWPVLISFEIVEWIKFLDVNMWSVDTKGFASD